MVKIIIHYFDHDPGYLIAAGSVEISNRITVMGTGERRETVSYFFNRFLGAGGNRTVVFL
jgi:hypothetical protein